VCVACIESTQPIRYTNAVGFVAPLYLGGAGKILLAEQKDQDLSLILGNMDLVPMTPITITDRAKLMEEIQKVRKQGYATSFGERIAGSASVSVAVRNYITPVALSMYAPLSRFKFDELNHLLDQMKATSKEISKRLKAQMKDLESSES
jgi:IclR family transcriptional regulator, KDG regulon repressor